MRSVGEFGFGTSALSIKSFPESLEYIGGYAFANLKQSSSVSEIPAKVVYIGASAFSGSNIVPEDKELLFSNPNITVLPATGNHLEGYSAEAFKGIGYTKFTFVTEQSKQAAESTNGFGSGVTTFEIA